MSRSRHEERLAKLIEEEAALEAATFGNKDGLPAEEDEQVLEINQDLNPDEPSRRQPESTDERWSQEPAHKDTAVDQSIVDELERQLAEATNRYNRYKGATDRTLFDLRTNVTNLTNRLSDSSIEISSLKKQIREGQPKQELFGEDVEEVFGSEATGAIKAIIDKQNQTISRLEAKLEEDENRQLTRAADTAEADNAREFKSNLGRLVPDLDNMNGDPEFNAWLRDYGQDGIVRLDRLRADQSVFDYHRVASFFIEYKNGKDASFEKASKRIVQDSVKNHIGPTGARSSESNTSKDESQKGYMYQSEINAYNRDVAKGLYRGRGTEADLMEARIFAAMQADKIWLDEQPNN